MIGSKTYRRGPAWAGPLASKSKGGHAGDYQGTKPEGSGETGKVRGLKPSKKTRSGKVSYKAAIPTGRP